jgi:hypothetical protein
MNNSRNYTFRPHMGLFTDCFAREQFQRESEETINDCLLFVADFKNAAEYWLFPYESPTFRYELEGVWDEVRPLYEQLHAYVRRKLRDLYGPDKLSRRAPLPAHILGNIAVCLAAPLYVSSHLTESTIRFYYKTHSLNFYSVTWCDYRRRFGLVSTHRT